MLMPSALSATRSGMSASRLPACAEPLAEVHVIVMVHHLVPGQRLVAIAVRERERRVVRRRRRLRARIQEHRHALRRARPRAVEREVGLVLGLVFVLGLPDAEARTTRRCPCDTSCSRG